LEIPSIRQFVLIAWKVRIDLFILSYNILSGLLLLFDKIKPRYLNFYTTATYFSLTLSFPLQFTYIASVFEILISKAFSSQNLLKQFSKDYSSSGDGASRTTSSANASKNSYNDAIVYTRLLLVLILCVL
jgi:hypothetical protein